MMSSETLTASTETQSHDPLVRPLLRIGTPAWALGVVLALIVVWGFIAWITQVRTGLGVTGMNGQVAWGLYITNFVFFIGISHVGALLSAILRLTGAGWRRPITRMAEAITVFALFVAMTQIPTDIGRPERIFHVFFRGLFQGRFNSPLIWDVLCVSIYFVLSITYLYLPMIPDLARLRDRQGEIAGWRQKLITFLAVGYTDEEGQHRRLHRWIGILSIAVIPVAISVHTVVSWVFSMTLVPAWHSTIFGPYFVVGAIWSGIAAVLITMWIFRRVFRLQEYLRYKQFNYLAMLLLVLNLVYLYFTFSEYLTIGYGREPADMRVFNVLFGGTFGSLMTWGFVIVGAVIPLLLLIFSINRPWVINATMIAALLSAGGMWVKRFLIVVPSLTQPMLAGLSEGVYRPSWVEWSITAGAFALFGLLFVIFIRIFPIISFWEMDELAEEEAVQEAAKKVTLAQTGASAD
jgi:molybdopterin-containing oxidoreductase family membrane subunit